MSEEAVRKLKETMVRKHGSYAAWKIYMHNIAVIGGKKSRRKLTKKDAARMGKTGAHNRWHKTG